MKKIFYFILFLGLINSTTAQIGIGKSLPDGDGLLDFAENSNKGILLPRVDNPDAGSVAGTLLYNINTKKVEYHGNYEWHDLSVKSGAFQVDEEYENYTEEQELNGVILGAIQSTAPGVLVLESTEKALILPKVANPHLNIPDPQAGMIAYDTVSKTVFVFNGLQWTVWGEK